ncbi:MAG: DUF7700 domain-containing protein [Myxococcota bacterium]
MTGTVYTVPPIPLDPAHTTYVEAGAIRIGVEYRLLDEAELEANYEGEAMDEIQEALDGAAVQDNGVSLHVIGVEDGHEYLRFDLFEQEPHYHYIDRSGESQTIIDFDRVAHGPMLPWALGQLRERLVPMLEHAGGGALVPRIDADRVAESLVEVEKLAREAEAALARGRK